MITPGEEGPVAGVGKRVVSADCSPPVPSSPTKGKRSATWGSSKPRATDNDDHSESLHDTSELFGGCSARLTQFSKLNYDLSTNLPPVNSSSTIYNETLVAEGRLRIYRMLGRKATYIQCGQFVHPILPRLRFWRVAAQIFILPQPVPGRFWRLELQLATDSAAITDFETALSGSCFYIDVQIPPDEPQESSHLEPLRPYKRSLHAPVQDASLDLPVVADSDVSVAQESPEHPELQFAPIVEAVEPALEAPFEPQSDTQAEVPVEDDSETISEISTLSSDPSIPEEPATPESYINDTSIQDISFPTTVDLEEPIHSPQSVPLQPADFTGGSLTDDGPKALSIDISSSSTLDEILDTFDPTPYRTVSPFIVQASEPVLSEMKDDDEDETMPEELEEGDVLLNPRVRTESSLDEQFDGDDSDRVSISDNSTVTSTGTVTAEQDKPSSSDWPFVQHSALNPQPPMPKVSSAENSYARLDRLSPFPNHPLIPHSAASLKYFQSHTPRFKPMEEDWVEVTLPNGLPPSYHASLNQPQLGYLNWVSHVTSDLVSSSSNYVSDKMEGRVNMNGVGHFPSFPQKPFFTRTAQTGDVPVQKQESDLEGTPAESSPVPGLLGEAQPDLYQQIAAVSGYMGWQLMNKVSGWVRK